MNEAKSGDGKTLWRIAAAVAAALARVLVLSAYVALTQISRPVSQLARIMQRLTEHQYDDVIPATDRRGRGGHHGPCVAGLQEHDGGADQLTAQVQRSEEARRLSEQLMDLTSAIPGVVFQLHLQANGKCRFLFVSDKASAMPGLRVLALLRSGRPVGEAYAVPRPVRQRIQTAFMERLRNPDFWTLTQGSAARGRIALAASATARGGWRMAACCFTACGWT